MKKIIAIFISIAGIIGAIIAFLLSQKKSDRDMAKMKKIGRQMDEELKRFKARSKVSEVKASESIKDHRDNFGDTVDDTLEFIERGKRPNT